MKSQVYILTVNRKQMYALRFNESKTKNKINKFDKSKKYLLLELNKIYYTNLNQVFSFYPNYHTLIDYITIKYLYSKTLT